jgi:hypothetical protein
MYTRTSTLRGRRSGWWAQAQLEALAQTARAPVTLGKRARTPSAVAVAAAAAAPHLPPRKRTRRGPSPIPTPASTSPTLPTTTTTTVSSSSSNRMYLAGWTVVVTGPSASPETEAGATKMRRGRPERTPHPTTTITITTTSSSSSSKGGREALAKAVRQAGATVVASLDARTLAAAGGRPRMVVVADVPRRTLKYLAALAAGVPCVGHAWVHACVREVARNRITVQRGPADRVERGGASYRLVRCRCARTCCRQDAPSSPTRTRHSGAWTVFHSPTHPLIILHRDTQAHRHRETYKTLLHIVRIHCFWGC